MLICRAAWQVTEVAGELEAAEAMAAVATGVEETGEVVKVEEVMAAARAAVTVVVVMVVATVVGTVVAKGFAQRSGLRDKVQLAGAESTSDCCSICDSGGGRNDQQCEMRENSAATEIRLL